MKTVLTIAGSDCSGGAGIQGDIKTITSHRLYAMSAITSLTAQNTTGVYGIMDVNPEFLENQLNCIFNDIFPDSIKIGMVSNSKLIEIIANKLIEFNSKNIVLDPVMISTSGSKLLLDNATNNLIKKLLPLATIITPNIPEAEVLSGIKIISEEDMLKAAKIISSIYKGAILIKGGHNSDNANDMLYKNGKVKWYYGEKINNNNTHGTGCTLSSAIACNLALGYTIEEAINSAKEYMNGALKANLKLGKGNGPINHMFNI